MGALALLIASSASAAQYVYPIQGQDQARQTKDEAECSTWATQQTGFDPSKASAASLTGGLPSGLGGSAAALGRGAVPGGGGLGSAAGMLGGAGGHAWSAGDLGVAASAIPGLGGAAGAAQPLAMLDQARGQQQPAKPGRTEYDQARAACLIGRGYSVR